MADEDFGSRNITTVPQSAPLPSRELGTVIINSGQNAQKNLNAVDQSTDIAGPLKERLDSLIESERASSEKRNDEIGKLQKRGIEEQLKREREAAERNAQQILNTMSRWANNPLQGVSDIIDGGFKGVFASLQTAWNTPISDVAKGVQETTTKITAPFAKLVEGTAGFIKAVTDKQEEIEEVDLDSLIEGDGGSSKQAKDERKQKEAEKEEKDEDRSRKQVAATEGVGLTVGGLLTKYLIPLALGVGLFIATFPVLYSAVAGTIVKLTEFTIPLWFNDLLTSLKLLFGVELPKKFDQMIMAIQGKDPDKAVDEADINKRIEEAYKNRDKTLAKRQKEYDRANAELQRDYDYYSDPDAEDAVLTKYKEGGVTKYKARAGREAEGNAILAELRARGAAEYERINAKYDVSQYDATIDELEKAKAEAASGGTITYGDLEGIKYSGKESAIREAGRASAVELAARNTHDILEAGYGREEMAKRGLLTEYNQKLDESGLDDKTLTDNLSPRHKSIYLGQQVGSNIGTLISDLKYNIIDKGKSQSPAAKR